MTAFFEKSYKNTRTIKSPDFKRNQDFFFAFYSKKFGAKIYKCRFRPQFDPKQDCT